MLTAVSGTRRLLSIAASNGHQAQKRVQSTVAAAAVQETFSRSTPVVTTKPPVSLTVGKVSIPDGFQVPVPKALRVADGNYYGCLTGVLALAARGGSGVFVLGWRPTSQRKELWPGTLGVLRDGSVVTDNCCRPTAPVTVYDNEADPECMLVREACSMLDLSMDVIPSHSGSQANQSLLQDGTVQLNDAESAINYLFDKYGPGRDKIPLRLRGQFAVYTAKLASLLRGNAGRDLSAAARPDRHLLKPLTLWGYENSPFVRPVRETLSSLGLRHTLISCARGSANRDAMFRKTGRFQVPYLEDPNTGVCMYESGEIVKYLNAAYSVAPVPAENSLAAGVVRA